MTRYGPKLPLIVGPVIAAIGFALFAIPGTSGSYWSTFFPAFLVLGLGMAISVPPLNTVVMGAVGQEFAGAASGINNAVARVAGLLAIAIFGIVMVDAFAARLDRQLESANLPPPARQELQANRTKLAAIEIPTTLDPSRAVELKAAVSSAFLFAFRLIACCCAALALASAATAALLIHGEKSPKSAAMGAMGAPARSPQS